MSVKLSVLFAVALLAFSGWVAFLYMPAGAALAVGGLVLFFLSVMGSVLSKLDDLNKASVVVLALLMKKTGVKDAKGAAEVVQAELAKLKPN